MTAVMSSEFIRNGLKHSRLKVESLILLDISARLESNMLKNSMVQKKLSEEFMKLRDMLLELLIPRMFKSLHNSFFKLVSNIRAMNLLNSLK